MANYTAGAIGVYAKKLTAGVVDTVTFPSDLYSLEVVSDGAAALYFTIDGSAPVVGSGDTYEMPAGGVGVRTVPGALGVRPGAKVVQLISAGTPTYSVSRG